MSTRSRNKSASTDMSAQEMTTAFLTVLDNADVVAKLASCLSVSIELIFGEKLNPLSTKLDTILAENKALQNRICKVEQENEKLKQQNDGLQATAESLNHRINALEQASRKCNIIIDGITETYAERASATLDGGNATESPREDTLTTVCKVLQDACKVTVSPADISSAARLPSKNGRCRPLLVSFHSSAMRSAVVKARQPRQTLMYAGSPIYINDHLTKFNSDLSYKARQLVKHREAHSSWSRDGQIFIKWSPTSRPALIQKMSDFD